jgi:membrane-bound lytic murein transglycosylase D
MKLRPFWSLGLLFGAVCAPAAETPKKVAPAPTEVSADDLFEAGKELFDTLAPPEVKEQFEFPDKAQWDDLVGRLQAALDGDDLEALAQYEPQVQAALVALRALPGSESYVAWLEGRQDYVEAAREVIKHPPPPPPVNPPEQFIPNYELWRQRVQARGRPAAADKYVARLQPLFVAGQVPGPLVWLAEVESGFNPSARSPAGAGGLFQLMPATARELGLRTFLPDERTDPEKSARAAARMLRSLYAKFGDWPLTLAAYNAGAGRVQRALVQRKVRTFAGIAPALSVETRLYVPKVLATLQVRAGATLTGAARP